MEAAPSLIALEEHFAAPGLLPDANDVAFFDPDQLAQIDRLLPDLALQDVDTAWDELTRCVGERDAIGHGNAHRLLGL